MSNKTITLPFEEGEWVDADTRMFHACFLVLGDFVEKELGKPEEGWDCYKGYRIHSCGGNDEKAIDLWLWYHLDLPKLEEYVAEDLENSYIEDKTSPFGMSPNPDYTEKYEYNHVENVCDSKLRELIDLRRHLWT